MLAEDNGQMGRIFPNPTSDGMIHIEMMQATLGEDLEIQLISATGELLNTQVLLGGAGIVDLPLEDHPSGVYFVRLLRGDDVETHRVIISN